MEPEIEIKDRIIQAAFKHFFLHGFSKVTMDEIASSVGMSKKTIYKFYPSKTELLCAVSDGMLFEAEAGIRNIIQNPKTDFLEKIKAMVTFVGIHLSKLSKPLVDDIRLNAPQLWKKISDFRTKNIYENFSSLIREGIQKKMLRDDVDENLFLLIYAKIIEDVINPEILSQLPLSAIQLYENIVKIVFEGILTEEARTQLKPLTKIS
jgi:AcrR family transcriptional regulator